MPAAAVAGGVAIAGLAGQYFASKAQAKAAKQGANAQIQAQAMAIQAQKEAEERARKYYEPFRQLGLRAATPVSDSQYAQMTGRTIQGQNGWNYSPTGTPYRIGGGGGGAARQNAMSTPIMQGSGFMGVSGGNSGGFGGNGAIGGGGGSGGRGIVLNSGGIHPRGGVFAGGNSGGYQRPSNRGGPKQPSGGPSQNALRRLSMGF